MGWLGGFFQGSTRHWAGKLSALKRRKSTDEELNKAAREHRERIKSEESSAQVWKIIAWFILALLALGHVMS